MMKSLAVAATLLLASVACAAPGDAIYTKPGRIVAADDGARLNLTCMGKGSPAVIFDSGWEDWAPAWALVQPRVAKWTRACSYDRAGAGFSDAGPLPRTSVRIADELHSALHNAGIAGPYILVGHAFGGDNVRVFADRHMEDVAGLVLVDADADDVEPANLRDDDHRGHVENIVELRSCRDLVASGKPLPLLPARSGRPPSNCAQQFFRGLPEASWSRELNARLLQIAQTKLAMFDAYISEMEQMAWDETYLQQHRRSFGARPVRVLTTGYHGVHALDVGNSGDLKQRQYENTISKAQARWLELSSNARQIFVANSSEYIQLDQPQAVAAAIREVYDQGKPHNQVP